MSRVEIVNPLPDGMRYTSVERALKYVELGFANMTRDGRLFFVLERQNQFVDRLSAEDYIRQKRGGVVCWNGSPKPKVLRKVAGRHTGSAGETMRRPGEVRS